jgi:ribA/ribD-fused uncharacterized protein
VISFGQQPCLTESDLPSPAAFVRFQPFIKGVFSQWHCTPFTLEGQDFVCVEQFMMAAKAVLFDDMTTAQAIMASDDPSIHKRLGAQVSGFDQAEWDTWRLDIVYRGNRAKFSQNDGACRQLRNSADAMLVEANPRDWNWGNGLHLDDPGNNDPSQWRGTNFLGRILTLIRDELA